MADLLLRKIGAGYLAPYLDSDIEAVAKWKHGEHLRCKVTKPNDGPLHAKLMVMLQEAFSMQEQYDDFIEFRQAVVYKAGHTVPVKMPGGGVIDVPGSISYESMDAIQRRALYPVVRNVLVTMFLPPDSDEALSEAQSRILDFF